MTITPSSPLVSTEWLAQHLDAPDVRVVDASWYLPGEERDVHDEFQRGHIPGAVLFDIDEICDTQSPYPHMLPSPEKFSSRVRALGIGDGHRVVVYDTGGIFSAPRVWWMFRVMGHEDVVVLDGGLKKWKLEDRPVTDSRTRVSPSHFTARRNTVLIRDRDGIMQNLDTCNDQVIDARSGKRFRGEQPEPRQGIRAGHIPGSSNLPWTTLITHAGTMREKDELIQLFTDAGLDLRRPVVTTCGSGISACILALGLAVLGHMHVPVYDGSWAEWGSDENLPVE